MQIILFFQVQLAYLILVVIVLEGDSRFWLLFTRSIGAETIFSIDSSSFSI